MRPILAAALVVAVCLALPAAASEPVDQVTAAPAACDWQAEYHGTIAALGENTAGWRVVDGGINGARGTIIDWQGIVASYTECEKVSSVVRHEWMHLQQLRSTGEAAFGQPYPSHEHMELVADCGSKLLGSEHTPYVDEQKRIGCTPAQLDAARALINHR